MHLTTLPMISKNLARWMMTPLLIPSSSPKEISTGDVNLGCALIKILDLNCKRGKNLWCAARRQVRNQNWDEDEDEDDKDYGRNEEISMLELYSQSARGEALLVHAIVDHEEVDVLIFKGLSSCLSYSTSPDPSRSILPARAVIKTIDRIKGPFDPANIEYLQKGVTWEEFRTNHL